MIINCTLVSSFRFLTLRDQNVSQLNSKNFASNGVVARRSACNQCNIENPKKLLSPSLSPFTAKRIHSNLVFIIVLFSVLFSVSFYELLLYCSSRLFFSLPFFYYSFIHVN